MISSYTNTSVAILHFEAELIDSKGSTAWNFKENIVEVSKIAFDLPLELMFIVVLL